MNPAHWLYMYFGGRASISWYEHWTQKRILKQLFLSDTGALEKTLHIHCSGLSGDRAHWVNIICLFGKWSCKECSSLTQEGLCTFIQVSQETELKVAETGETSPLSFPGLPGDKHNDSIWQAFLEDGHVKEIYQRNYGKASACLFRSPGRQSYKADTLGKPLHIHCSGLLRDRVCQVNMIGLLGRWSCKWHSSLTQRSLCILVQVSWDTELLKSIWQAYLEDSLEKVFPQWQWWPSVLHIYCSGLQGDRASIHTPGRQSFMLIW